MFIPIHYNGNCVSLVNNSDILHPQNMCRNQLFTSFALLFRPFFRGTINNIVTVFVSDFSESVRSRIDRNQISVVLPLLSSFVPSCNIMRFGLNSRITSLTWSHMHLT